MDYETGNKFHNFAYKRIMHFREHNSFSSFFRHIEPMKASTKLVTMGFLIIIIIMVIFKCYFSGELIALS